MNAKQKLSRFQRVQQILDDAQGKCVPDYQGLGAFWRDLDTLVTAELYGQRLIAPEPGQPEQPPDQSGGKSCCGGGNTAASLGADESALNQALLTSGSDQPVGNCWPSGGKNPARVTASGIADAGEQSAPPAQSRSDQSGLIKGLRRQFPFDGTQFPPLLWQTQKLVSPADITFIAAWLDDGCPETDDTDNPVKSGNVVLAHDGTVLSSATLRALARGDARHTVSSRHPSEISDAMQGVKVRKEVSSLSTQELSLLREALRCMYTYDPHIFDERSFNYWARIHTDSCQHGWEQFLPWHRLYLYFFEQTLQDYDARITLPYWSWSDYADVNRKTYDTEQLDIGVLP
ncbi:MAG: tyrosinase family protein, partial [Nitrosomonas sp.]|nr:tyrosinase family protein [Nitrosomonas sp.]